MRIAQKSHAWIWDNVWNAKKNNESSLMHGLAGLFTSEEIEPASRNPFLDSYTVCGWGKAVWLWQDILRYTMVEPINPYSCALAWDLTVSTQISELTPYVRDVRRWRIWSSTILVRLLTKYWCKGDAKHIDLNRISWNTWLRKTWCQTTYTHLVFWRNCLCSIILRTQDVIFRIFILTNGQGIGRKIITNINLDSRFSLASVWLVPWIHSWRRRCSARDTKQIPVEGTSEAPLSTKEEMSPFCSVSQRIISRSPTNL